MQPSLAKISIILVGGVLSVSSSAIFVRLAFQAVNEPNTGFSLLLAASRLAIASILLLPSYPQLWRRRATRQSYYYALGAGLCLALHFSFWITSLSLTSIAAATTLVTTNPIWISLISWLWLKSKPSQLTLVGILLGIFGGMIISLAQTPSGAEAQLQAGWGNILALLGAIMVSLYFLAGRAAQKRGLTTSNYILIAYSTAALILLPLPLFWRQNYGNQPLEVYLYIILLAIFPQLLGHSSLNWCLKFISPIAVSLVVLLEPPIATGLGIIFLGEVPSNLVILGGLIVLLGVGLGIIGSRNPNG